MSRAFKTRAFDRWLRKSGLSDTALSVAVEEMDRGLIDADLGGHVIKKRVAMPGLGKRGSTRTLVATNFRNRWIFLYGFEKSERSNIDVRELGVLQELAKNLLALDDHQIDEAVHDGALQEISHGNQTNKSHS